MRQPLDTRLTVRFRRGELVMIKIAARKSHLTPSAYVRKVVMEYSPKQRISPEESIYLRQASRLIEEFGSSLHAEIAKNLNYFLLKILEI